MRAQQAQTVGKKQFDHVQSKIRAQVMQDRGQFGHQPTQSIEVEIYAPPPKNQDLRAEQQPVRQPKKKSKKSKQTAQAEPQAPNMHGTAMPPQHLQQELEYAYQQQQTHPHYPQEQYPQARLKYQQQQDMDQQQLDEDQHYQHDQNRHPNQGQYYHQGQPVPPHHVQQQNYMNQQQRHPIQDPVIMTQQ